MTLRTRSAPKEKAAASSARHRIAVGLTALLVAGCGFAGDGGERLTFEIHNESDQPVTLDIVDAGDGNPAEGDVIAAPITLPAGASDPVTIVAPTTEWALRVRGVDGFFSGRDLRDWVRQLAAGEIEGFRLVINRNGDVSAETTGAER